MGSEGGDTMSSILENVGIFLGGIGTGIALHRMLMGFVLDKWPDDLCAYCEWLGRKKSRHKRK